MIACMRRAEFVFALRAGYDLRGVVDAQIE
jgi:hypothetical protein